MNPLIGKKLDFQHTGYECIECGKNEPIFRMGFCKKCFFESPYASESIVRPELSQAHLGIEERNLAAEREIQLQPHIVYLAYTGDVKVGVTRESQIPTRWIDQGASFALPIVRTTNRYEAGMIEVELKKYLSDKTNWRKMLADDHESLKDLNEFYSQIRERIPAEYQGMALENPEVVKIDYPYASPGKIKSINLEKQPKFEGVLKGIKGQYLSFEDGSVMNVRSHEGYTLCLSI